MCWLRGGGRRGGGIFRHAVQRIFHFVLWPGSRQIRLMKSTSNVEGFFCFSCVTKRRNPPKKALPTLWAKMNAGCGPALVMW